MYGFQSFNNANITQIDDNYRNLLYVASGSWTGGNAVLWQFTFPAQTSTSPMVFVRPWADGTYVGQGGITADTCYFSTNGNFDWVVYGLDNPVMSSGSAYGMQVFNGSGQTVFDSRYEPARIQAVVRVDQTWPTYTQGGSYGAWPHYPYTLNFTGWGEKPWICLNALYCFDDDNGTTTAATTSGTNSIILRCGNNWGGSTGWQWFSNDGGGAGYALSHPYGQVRIPLLKR